MSNQAMPGLVKIGYTNKDPKRRASELYATGVPYPFQIEATVQTHEPEDLERRVHAILGAKRVHGKREFFDTSVEKAVHAISVAAYEKGRRVRKYRPSKGPKKYGIFENTAFLSTLVVCALPVPTLTYVGTWEVGIWIALCFSAVTLGIPAALKFILGALGKKFNVGHVFVILMTALSAIPNIHAELAKLTFVVGELIQSYLFITFHL